MDKKIAGVVLAGGRSSRMGQDKALLDCNGQKLLDHMIALLEQTGLSDIYVSGTFEGYDCIPDSAQHQGPARAMQDVLENLSDYAGVVFVPVDMPFLNAEVLGTLLEQDQGGYFEGAPLPVFIKQPCPNTTAASVREFLSILDVPSVALPSGFKKIMINVNTPEDWQEALST